MTEPTLHPSLLCRAHLHHKWVSAQTEDGGQYTRCARCGKDKLEPDRGNPDNIGLSLNP